MRNASNVINPVVTEQNGLTRLTFDLPSDVVISKNIIPQMNSLPFLLPVEYIEKMAGCDVIYSAGGLISLPKYLRQARINLNMAIKILRGICDTVTRVKENGLYSDNLSYVPDHIFIDAQSVELKMVLLPFETGVQTAPALKALLLTLSSELMAPDYDAAGHMKEIAEYCGQPDFKLVSFFALLDELTKFYKPAKRKKEKRQKNGRSFWNKLFHKKEKIAEQPDASGGSDMAGSQTVTRKRSGTELLLPDDEKGITTATADPAIIKTAAKMVRLTISINGMTSETEISSFPCVLGRSPMDANVILQDSGVSRKHAVIDWSDGGFFIYDLGSSNGLILNGAKLAPKAGQPIANGDIIKIGRVEIRVSGIDGV